MPMDRGMLSDGLWCLSLPFIHHFNNTRKRLAGKVGFSSLATQAPCQLAAARLRWSNRIFILNHTRREKQKAP
jgi:hypothetical protein